MMAGNPVVTETTLAGMEESLVYDYTGAAYRLISFLLSYPDHDEFWASLQDARAWAIQWLDTNVAFKTLFDAIEALSGMDESEAAKAYVDAFDFNESASLYLTAHELGDSRSRGPALIALRKLFQQNGYEEATKELPDYVPTLLELLSALPDRPADLEKRLATVCSEIRNHLKADSVYKLIIDAAVQVLPGGRTENPFPLHEKTDLDELPYPLMYDE